jgi:hypothetical protein
MVRAIRIRKLYKDQIDPIIFLGAPQSGRYPEVGQCPENVSLPDRFHKPRHKPKKHRNSLTEQSPIEA